MKEDVIVEVNEKLGSGPPEKEESGGEMDQGSPPSADSGT
jgi:hypothetical protein